MLKDLLNNIVISPAACLVTISSATVSHNKVTLNTSIGDCIEILYHSVNINSQDSKSYRVNSIKFNRSDMLVDDILNKSSYIDIYDLDSILSILKGIYSKCEILERYKKS